VAAAGLAPATADITVRDDDVWHTFRDAKDAKLGMAWYRRLPEWLQKPEAVILDKTMPNESAYLLVYPAQEGTVDKLVVRINLNKP
jgi:hypothetical protein